MALIAWVQQGRQWRFRGPLQVILVIAWMSGAVASAEPPATGARSTALAALGAKLFFDAKLSADGTVSCATCHVPEQAFSDGRAQARGAAGAVGTRNTPSLIGVAEHAALSWDGRHTSLEAQARAPFLNRAEHGLGTLAELTSLLRQDESYGSAFRAAFGPEAQVGAPGAFAALAAFQRSLVPGPTAFERYQFGGERSALGAAAQRGLALFKGRAQCADCHLIEQRTAPLTDGRFHSMGVGQREVAEQLPTLLKRLSAAPAADLDALIANDHGIAALGRFAVTGNPEDIGAFRTPDLRNVALTGPYMHDGSVATLEEAVERELHYRRRQDGKVLVLTLEERADLVAFLRALTSSNLADLATSSRAMAVQTAAPGQ